MLRATSWKDMLQTITFAAVRADQVGVAVTPKEGSAAKNTLAAEVPAASGTWVMEVSAAFGGLFAMGVHVNGPCRLKLWGKKIHMFLNERV